jgi:hypothetical protein
MFYQLTYGANTRKSPAGAVRLGEASERLRAQIGEIEQPADLPARCFGDDQRVRHGQRLHRLGSSFARSIAGACYVA